MDMKAIFLKAAKGEPLTDEEKAALAAYDPEKDRNDTAAAARKKAEDKARAAEAARSELEARVKELEESIEAAKAGGQTDLQKLQKDLEKLTAKLTEREKAVQTLEADKRKLVRDGKLGKVRGGIRFVDGFDQESAAVLVERAFADIKDEDLDDEAAVAKALTTFRERHKGVLLDDSGHGAGSKKDGAPSAGKFTLDQVKAMPPEEFLKNKDAIWNQAKDGEVK